MKKLFVIISILGLFISMNIGFANANTISTQKINEVLIANGEPMEEGPLDTYKLQETFESKELRTFKTNPKFLLFDDVLNYMDNNNTDSIYGRLLAADKSSSYQINGMDKMTLETLISLYKNAYNDFNLAEMYKVEDEQYSELPLQTKKLIAFYNSLINSKQVISLAPVKNSVMQEYERFLADKNNMKQNKEIYDNISYSSSRLKDFVEYLKKRPNNQEELEEAQNTYNDVSSITNEIYQYSYNYEKTKFQNWAKRNNKKIVCGALSNYVYMPNVPTPQIGCLYEYLPQRDFTLHVMQTVPGGVIMSGRARMAVNFGGSTLNNIFIQTSKSFADNQAVLKPLMVEFKGYYDYTTILGVKKRIYKFYRLGQSEIDANFKIPNQPLYFYKPY